ncbi:MAG: glycosyltransferase, partial [Clostridia bacterium]|nr:glycosyltransferase [Clostridia bacterium]
FEYATGDCVVELDCDLQDPIEAVSLMIEKWEEGYKLIHGRRRSREGDSFFKKVCAVVYNKLLMKLSGINVETRSGDFKLYDRQVVDAIVSLPENNKYMRGVSSWVGFKQCSIDFDRKERYAGKTSFNFRKLVKLAKDGLVSNSNKPLSLPYYIGGFVTFNSVLCFLIFTILCCCSITLPLLAWVFPTISFFFGLTFMLMSLSNCYLGKVYDQAKGRPSFIVEETKNIDNK